jgi:hypothetical protein
MNLNKLLREDRNIDEVIAVKNKKDVVRASDILEKIGLSVFTTPKKRKEYLGDEKQYNDFENMFMVQDSDGFRIQSHYLGQGTTTDDLEKIIDEIVAANPQTKENFEKLNSIEKQLKDLMVQTENLKSDLTKVINEISNN